MGTDCILNTRVVNIDAASYAQKTPEKSLLTAEQKRCKYLDAYIQQRCHFPPFVVSVDGLLDTETEATLKRLASRLAAKWRKPYSWSCGYIRSRVAITMVRATHRCIQDSRVPTNRIIVQRAQWEDGARINLYR